MTKRKQYSNLGKNEVLMITLVKDSHILQSGTSSTFTINFNHKSEKFGSLFEEYAKSAEEIWSLKTGKLYLMYSGGVDSEYTLSVFLRLKIPIIPVIIKLNPGYNNHDLEYALKFCHANNLSPEIIDIDFDHFVKSGKLYEYASRYKSSVYHRSATMHAISQINGTVIMGDSEPYIRKNTKNNRWYFCLSEHDYAIPKFFEENNIPGTPHFNGWSQGQYRTFISDSIMTRLARDLIPGKLGSNSSKIHIYNREPEIQLTPRPKFTGYEIIEKSPIFAHEEFQKLLSEGESYEGEYLVNYFKLMSDIDLAVKEYNV